MVRSFGVPMLLVCWIVVGASAQDSRAIVHDYGDVARRITTAALVRNEAMAYLVALCDGVGHRLSGSPALDRAIALGAELMKRARLENVHTEPVMVPVWIRGATDVELLEPRRTRMAALALGGSIGTGATPIEAPAVVVHSFDELKALPRSAVEGRVVVFDVPYVGYGKTVPYRVDGAVAAAKQGAVAALVRSVGHGGVRTPHTGAMHYADGVPQIPNAAISAEDAAMLGRLAKEGTPLRVHLGLGCESRPDAPSANLMGELRGREKPDEIVVIGGHVDSWDVGQGAQDDGGGITTSLAAVALLRRLDLVPRRTIRVVWWTNEENGTRGAAAYHDAHKSEWSNHVAALETDGGVELPTGFGLSMGGREARGAPPTPPTAAQLRAFDRVAGITELLGSVGCSTLSRTGGGADIGPLMAEGVPGLSISTTGERYFEWHHTEGDTVDKIDPKHLDLHVAALAVMIYVLADMPERL